MKPHKFKEYASRSKHWVLQNKPSPQKTGWWVAAGLFFVTGTALATAGVKTLNTNNPRTIDDYLTLFANPNIQALARAIAVHEAGAKDGNFALAYRRVVNGGTRSKDLTVPLSPSAYAPVAYATSLSDYPFRSTAGCTSKYACTAAGAYQALIGTWKEFKATSIGRSAFEKYRFNESTQNIFYVEKLRTRGQLGNVLQGKFATAITGSLALEWASMPKGGKGTAYPRGNKAAALGKWLADVQKYLGRPVEGAGLDGPVNFEGEVGRDGLGYNCGVFGNVSECEGNPDSFPDSDYLAMTEEGAVYVGGDTPGFSAMLSRLVKSRGMKATWFKDLAQASETRVLAEMAYMKGIKLMIKEAELESQLRQEGIKANSLTHKTENAYDKKIKELREGANRAAVR